MKKDLLFIQTEKNPIVEYNIENVGITLFLYLKQFNDLTEEQSKQLINEGLVIGRPHGYTFTNYAFVYLLSLSVDLLGLIKGGFAKDAKGLI